MKNFNQAVINEYYLEKSLEDFLHPVEPKDKFVNTLYQRLKNRPAVTIEYPNILVLVVVVLMGFFTGIFLLWILLRSKNRLGKN